MSVQAQYHLKDSGIIYDVTNTYLYGKNCPLGKLGHDKEGVKGRPLIQIGLGVTRQEGIPVFHKTFHGDVHDVRRLHDLITSLSQIDTMYKVYLRDAKKNFSLSKTVTLTKKQALILKTIDKQLLKS